MKGFATAVVYGPEERGGYRITNTPEGIQKAKDLLTNDRYLYHVRCFINYIWVQLSPNYPYSPSPVLSTRTLR